MHSNGSGGAIPAGNCTATSRTIALVGPFGSGKTTLFEALLARTGAISKMGDVNKGTSVGDASSEARNHNMSIEANFGSAVFMGDKYTFVDCPGSVEFQYEQQPILAIADLAIVVCEPDEKKIPALQLILRSLEQLKIPHVLFLNKIDKYATSVRDSLALMQVASEIPLMIRQIPIWKNGIAIGAIDLALERALIYREHAE
ncbi:MAG: GTP-binding protein, partial [Cohaesibacteraceae bacterium]|nr:GTP-binding protein [Cohaesibacteraceae bacterium]